MKTKITFEKVFEENRRMCNHILKLSKINNPEHWKKYGQPHISIWVDLKNKKYDSFRVAFPDGVWNETVVHFYAGDVKMNVKQFKKSKQLGIIKTKQ